MDFIAGLGTGSTRRERLISGFARIERHENDLVDKVRQGFADIAGLTLYQSEGPKTAIVAFTLDGRQPGDVCRELCDRYGIFAADGIFYAQTLAHRLGVDRLDPGRIHPVQYKRRSGSPHPKCMRTRQQTINFENVFLNHSLTIYSID